MKKNIKIIFSTIFLIVFLTQSQTVFATGEFSSSLENSIYVAENGQTTVKKTFTITNNQSSFYLKKYGLDLSSSKISKIKVISQGEEIDANITQSENKTTIGIEFPDIVVGKDRSRVFTIEYIDPDSGIISGNILEVYLARLADPKEFAQYDTIIDIPSKFGKPAIATPSEYTIKQQDDRLMLKYDNAGREDGISVIFGEKQFFDFSLDYHLENPTGNTGITQITLPPDTQFQQVKYSDINPRPETMEIDPDGNWIATYILQPNQKETIKAEGIATVYLKPLGSYPVISPDIAHIQPTTQWETKEQTIEALAMKHNSPKEIFDFVVNALEYNDARVSLSSQRLGAKRALEDPNNAVCQEYTDVFVTLARANSIPARQATGFAFTNNAELRPLSFVQDILHAWPEYFDDEKKLWIPVDPTWSDTTGGVDYFSQLDFNHFVFSYQGMHSDKPYPAGSYKQENIDTKDVNVSLTDEDLSITPDFLISIDQPQHHFLGLRAQHTLKIKNESGQAYYNVPVDIRSSENTTVSTSGTVIERFLPYQTYIIPLYIQGEHVIGNQPAQAFITVAQTSMPLDVSAGSRFQEIIIHPYFLYSTAAAGIIASVLLTLFLAKLLFTKRKRKK